MKTSTGTMKKATATGGMKKADVIQKARGGMIAAAVIMPLALAWH